MKLSRVTLCLPTKNRRVSHAFYVALGFEAVGELEPMQRAKEAGAKVVFGPGTQDWGYAGAFTDPDGHMWQVTLAGGFLSR